MITEFYIENNTLRIKAEPTFPAIWYEFGLLWYHNTYKDLTESIDIELFVIQNSTEGITITAADLGLTVLNGIFYIQLFDNYVEDFDPLVTPLNNNHGLAVATNLGLVYKAFLDLLEKEITNFDCNCEQCLSSTNLLTKIEAIKIALTLEDFESANSIYNRIQEELSLCQDCDFIEVPTGYNIGTFDNVIKII